MKGPLEQPRIFFLNGPSSSGKTTLAKNLQWKLEFPYLHIGLDHLISMMPAKINNWEGEVAQGGFWWRRIKDMKGQWFSYIQEGPFAKKLSRLFRRLVLSMIDQGYFLIIDDVCTIKKQLLLWKKTLSPFLVMYIRVTADADILEERGLSRGNRIAGCGRAQREMIHQDIDWYDVEIDTTHSSPDACACQLIEEGKRFYRKRCCLVTPLMQKAGNAL